ncbi:MAG TPA: Na+/H+ antiporter NhaC family protein, partial [Clostridiales bacterium]|nr:Na+/H+ antiporter NhaC family protein [Clostridiales bacterium]
MKKRSNLIAFFVFLAVLALILICNAVGVTFVNTAWSLLPPLVAIVLALITKEAYSSLFAGVLLGAIMAANGSFMKTVDLVTVEALTAS